MEKELENEFKDVYTKILSLEKRQARILEILKAVATENDALNKMLDNGEDWR